MSALDVPVQVPIPNLLRELQPELGLSYLVIAHSIDVVEYVADRVAMMRVGADRSARRTHRSAGCAWPGLHTRAGRRRPGWSGCPLADAPLTFLTVVFS